MYWVRHSCKTLDGRFTFCERLKIAFTKQNKPKQRKCSN